MTDPDGAEQSKHLSDIVEGSRGTTPSHYGVNSHWTSCPSPTNQRLATLHACDTGTPIAMHGNTLSVLLVSTAL